MKKIVALLLTAVMLSASLFALTSCGGDSDTPSGMKLAAGGKADGYYFYVPEEWTVSNVGAIKSAYISRVNTTSVSFTEIDAKSFPVTEEEYESYFFGSYFTNSLNEFPTGTELSITSSGEAVNFGKVGEEADRAEKYTFNYDYSEHKFGFMQILIKSGTRYFIFTYCALLEEKSDGKTYFEYYLGNADNSGKVMQIMDAFRFVGEAEAKTDGAVYEKDGDGYLLICNSSLSGFSLYAPESFKQDYASAIVSATHEDGSNINMTKATMTGAGITVSDYWELRKEELGALVGEITEIEVNKTAALGNSDAAFSYEYTFVYSGETYHVFQIYAIEGSVLSREGYVFTYTAKEANYNLHSEEINSIISKVKFK